MKTYIETLQCELERHQDPTIALGQKQYLKNQFDFYGLKTPLRRKIQKPFLEKAYLPSKQSLPIIIKALWNLPQREYHYFAQELAYKYIKQIDVQDIDLYYYMITHQSWWDTVDFIATKLIANYFKKYPDQISLYVKKWSLSDNLWTKRSAIIYQLHYKEILDTTVLKQVIIANLNTNEFFINKAIGWILRQYSRTNPDWVLDFVDNYKLSTLSHKEAIRLINK